MDFLHFLFSKVKEFGLEIVKSLKPIDKLVDAIVVLIHPLSILALGLMGLSIYYVWSNQQPKSCIEIIEKSEMLLKVDKCNNNVTVINKRNPYPQ